MLTGAAPISGQILDFMKIASCCGILEGYGQTESCGASFLTNIYDTESGHVGGPFVNTEFKVIFCFLLNQKVVDVPEMNYTSKDVINGQHCPRGEVCLRGPGIFIGYYKDLEKTSEAIDNQGWLHTGDIVMIRPNGSI